MECEVKNWRDDREAILAVLEVGQETWNSWSFKCCLTLHDEVDSLSFSLWLQVEVFAGDVGEPTHATAQRRQPTARRAAARHHAATERLQRRKRSWYYNNDCTLLPRSRSRWTDVNLTLIHRTRITLILSFIGKMYHKTGLTIIYWIAGLMIPINYVLELCKLRLI